MTKRNNKLSTRITLAISIIVIACIGVLFITANSNMASAMRQTANDNMVTSLEAKTQIIEAYVDDAESLLKAYGKSSEIKSLLKDPDNKELQAAAQEYTEKYYADLENWEGLYLADWDTHVLTHSNVSAIGITMRKDDPLKSLQDDILHSGGLYNTGIILSPASKKLTLSMYCPIYDEDKKTVLGMVGGGPFASNLKTVLDQLVINGMQNVKYTLINVNTGTYIFNEDETLMNTEVEEPLLLSVIDEVKNNPERENNTVEYAGTDGKDYMAVYKNMANHGWVLLLSDSEEEIYAQANSNRTVLGILCILSVLLILLISFAIIKFKTRPLQKITNAAKRISDGDFDVELDVDTHDEIGQLSDTLNLTIQKLRNYQGYIDEISDTLAKMEEGDMTVELKRDYAGQFAKLKENLYRFIKNTSSVLYNINTASEQVASSAGQVAGGAQALSQGATEQASSIQELSAVIMEISEHIRESAKNAQTASTLSGQAGAGVMESDQKMKDMIEAMQDISNKSNEISKIIKTIDDIAFQTNILALNAAVEAARAGTAGKGFAVVADEVRNLAGKSAEAAKSTTTLIEGTAQAVQRGTEIVNAAAESLYSVVDAETTVNETVQRIAAAATEQSNSVAQVTQGIEQISAVVQTNSATSEESAAASEELSGQAQTMKKLVGRFKLPDRAGGEKNA